MSKQILGRPHILVSNYRYRPAGKYAVTFELDGENFSFREGVHSAQGTILNTICLRFAGAICIVEENRLYDFDWDGFRKNVMKQSNVDPYLRQYTSQEEYLKRKKKYLEYIGSKPGIFLAGGKKFLRNSGFPGISKFPKNSIFGSGQLDMLDYDFLCGSAQSMKFYVKGEKIRLLVKVLVELLKCKGFWSENWNLIEKAIKKVQD